MTEQTFEQTGAPAPTATTTAAPAHLDPTDRAALVRALCNALRQHRISVQRLMPTRRHPLASAIMRCQGDSAGTLTQDIALSPDPNRPDHYAWYWLWADGLRSEGAITPEHMCEGEEIETAAIAVARVLGVATVAN